jgi:isopentenyl-diphosphate delta-isomerase type 1
VVFPVYDARCGVGSETLDEEFFDVVDANDKPIGRRSRAEVHQRRLFHRSVHVLVFNPSGQIYLQKRTMEKDEYPGCWDASVSGHVNAGETYEACAVRESMEELGLVLYPPLRPLLKLQACAETGYEFSVVYRVIHDGALAPDPVEIDAGQWFDPDELDAWMAKAPGEFTGPFWLIWRRVR